MLLLAYRISNYSLIKDREKTPVKQYQQKML